MRGETEVAVVMNSITSHSATAKSIARAGESAGREAGAPTTASRGRACDERSNAAPLAIAAPIPIPSTRTSQTFGTSNCSTSPGQNNSTEPANATRTTHFGKAVGKSSPGVVLFES